MMPERKSGQVGMTPKYSKVDPLAHRPQNQTNPMTFRCFMRAASSAEGDVGIGDSYPRASCYSTISGYPSSSPS